LFTHLHTHSYYSFLDATPSPKELAEAAAAQGSQALALTDHHGLTGALQFYRACHSHNIKPILGLDLAFRHGLGKGDLVLLAMDLEGWGTLCRLSTALQTHPSRDQERGLDFSLLHDDSAGLICLTGGQTGLLSRLVSQRRVPDARQYLAELAQIFGDRLYLQLIIFKPADVHLAEPLAALAAEAGLKIVAANDVHFLDRDQASLQKLLVAMGKNTLLGQLEEDMLPPAQAYLADSNEMTERFSDFPEAISQTAAIAERCNLDLGLGQARYPRLQLPQGQSADSVLRQRAVLGARERYKPFTQAIEDRLNHELETIAARGYAPLFLIMADILEFAAEAGVPSASRGSASSSLVAHCLDITTPDPIELNLYFERFLNPARESAPDIDTDLCSTRREKVIRFVYERYGHENVAMVATINRLQYRSALREVAKAHGLPESEIKALSSKVPRRSWGPRGQPKSSPYDDLERMFPQHSQIFRDARAVRKFPRHLSVHPGGIVVSPVPLTDLLPLHLAGKGIVITQMDLNEVQALGLVKIDLLGTRGLSVLGDVAEQVHNWNRTRYSSPLKVLADIPNDDPETAATVRSTQTIGCFQIESPGMRATLREVQAHSPDDILLALALYRPGPMTGGLKDAFVQRHLGMQAVEHIHPALSDLLKNTYGVILYQEQVLRIASQLAGLSLADADLLRRAMSHFDPGEQMQTLKRRFMLGAEAKSQVPPEIAEQIWDLMAAFAGYGFPKAHAASYARVGWQSAWCKTHFPAEFMAAVMANWGGYYRQSTYLREAIRMGLDLRPPHINHSAKEFRVVYPDGDPALYMGLGQVRELTRKTQSRILTGRPFRSLNDFLSRVDPRVQEVQHLIRVGALSGLGTVRGLLSDIEQGGWRFGQRSLFDEPAGANPSDLDLEPGLFEQAADQKEILGSYVDIHPLDLLPEGTRDRLQAISTAEAVQRVDEPVRVLGMRLTIQRYFQAGDPRFILELEDRQGVLAVVLTKDQQRRYRQLLSGPEPLLVEGQVQMDPYWQLPVMVAKKLNRIPQGFARAHS
jgi:DNA-directed DNA polymerase III PolC